MKHVFVWLAVAVHLSVSYDTLTTARLLNHNGTEVNPLARPITSLPRPAYIVTSEALAASVNFVAWKMKHSQHKPIRKVWWVPQTLTIAGATTGSVYTARHE